MTRLLATVAPPPADPVPRPVRKVAAGSLLAILIALGVLMAVVLLMVLRRSQQRRRAARRTPPTDLRNAWAEAGRRLAPPDSPDDLRPGGTP